MVQSSSTAALVAGSALLVASLAGYGLLSSSSSSNSSKSSSKSQSGKKKTTTTPSASENESVELAEIDENDNGADADGSAQLQPYQHGQAYNAADDGDFITAEEVVKVFDRLFLELQGMLGQLMQQIQMIQMAGQQIPERQLRALIRSELERGLTTNQIQVLEEFDMDYDCFEEATWEFLEQPEKFPKVKVAVERFQKMWENATGEPVVGYRPGKTLQDPVANLDILSPEKTIEAAEIYFSSLTSSMRTLIQQYKARGLSLNDPTVQQQLNMDFAANANQAGEDALKLKGVTQSQFEASVKHHSDDPAVGRALGMMQVRQQQELMALHEE